MVLLRDYLNETDIDDNVRVVILRGEGNVFTSGGDLNQTNPEDATPERARKTYRSYVAVQMAIRSIAKPVITMVDGYAVGGGFALMLASDLVCVSEEAQVIPAFCQIGIAPEMAVVKFLPELVGAQRAKEILFLGNRLTGRELYDLGIANRVCPSVDLEKTTKELALKLASMPDASIQVAKGMINAISDSNLSCALTMEQTASPFCTTTRAFAETQKKFAR